MSEASLSALVERLRARYPLIGLLGADEREGAAFAARAAQEAKLPCEICHYGTDDPAERALAALQRLSHQPSCLVLPAARTLLADPRLVRFLSERLEDLERNGQCVVLVGAVLPEIPELARDLVRLAVPLPPRTTLEPLARAALEGADGEQIEAAVRALQGLTLAQARRALRRVRVLPLPQALAELLGEKRELLAASGVVEVVHPVPPASAIGGLDELKAWLDRQRQALSSDARSYGLPVPRGVLLVGVQGCGKSLSAKAAAAILGLPLLRLDLGRLHGGEHGPDANLRHALAVAEAMAPVVLWIDEIDKAFAGAASGASESGARVFGSMLTWLGEQRSGVFVAATANRLAQLPAELMRKGRFDETFFVDVPDAAARAEILAVALRSSGRNPAEFDLELLAKASDRLTGAELEQAIYEGLQQAFAQARPPRSEDFAAVLAKTVPFVETYDTQVRELRGWARRHCRGASRDRSLHELFAAARQARPDAK